MIADHLAIIGLGLIGGSVALGARCAGAARHISGYDTDAIQREQAVSLGVVDDAPDSPQAAVQSADFVVLAVPVLETRTALLPLRDAIADHAVLTDVGSTKASVIDAVKAAFGTLPKNYVPVHPIAGTEKNGVSAAFAELFEDHHVILTPHEAMSPAAAEKVTALWISMGAHVERMSPEHHDLILAATSHLPHVLAYALVDMLAGMDTHTELFNYAAGGFRDFTRIAASSPKMWQDIVRANRDAVVPLMDRYINSLQMLRDAVSSDDATSISRVFGRAQDARKRYARAAEAGADAEQAGKT